MVKTSDPGTPERHAARSSVNVGVFEDLRRERALFSMLREQAARVLGGWDDVTGVGVGELIARNSLEPTCGIPPALGQGPLLGRVWEAFIYAELRKMLAAHAPDHQVWLYRDQQGKEVDFLVHGGVGDVYRVKWSELPDVDDAKWLRAVAALLEAARPAPLGVRRLIAARPHTPYPLEDGTRVVHGLNLAGEFTQGPEPGAPSRSMIWGRTRGNGRD
jgi:hypothetical protein